MKSGPLTVHLRQKKHKNFHKSDLPVMQNFCVDRVIKGFSKIMLVESPLCHISHLIWILLYRTLPGKNAVCELAETLPVRESEGSS